MSNKIKIEQGEHVGRRDQKFECLKFKGNDEIKVSDLIDMLSQAKEKFGDQIVYFEESSNMLCPISLVYFNDRSDEKRIVIY